MDGGMYVPTLVILYAPPSNENGGSIKEYTLQPLYNIVRYNTALDITLFKDGFQKCIDYIEKWP